MRSCLSKLPRVSLILAMLAVASAPARAAEATLVRTHTGPVTGLTRAGVRAYLGIPYAASPVGPRRWAPPADPEPWTLPRACTKFAPACPQGKMQVFRQLASIAEADSLALNVWTPARKPGEALPVMVWIHGGGFVQGTAMSAGYDGHNLARRGVVVVAINYRLGSIGFLAHPALSAESKTRTSGNYGLMDQIHALKWVRRNIAAFGGDPGNVTIFGESAGGVSVALHLASGPSRGLFHRAIMQSGSVPGRMRYRAKDSPGLPSAESEGQAFARRLLGPSADKMDARQLLQAMRAKSWQDVLAAAPSKIVMPGKTMVQWVCIDGTVLTESPAATLAGGRGAKVPFLAGSNADEGTLFTRGKAMMTVQAYRQLAGTFFGDHAAEALTRYPAKTTADVNGAMAKVLGDIFVHGARSGVRYAAAAGNKAWLYHFTATTRLFARMGLGCCHGSEIPYVFGNTAGKLMYGPADRALSDKMAGYWVRFAKTGDPNGAGEAAWPAYDAKTDRHLEFGTAGGQAVIKPGAHLRQKALDFLDGV